MLRVLCGILMVLALSGCQSGSARFVKRGADEGTIAIPFDDEKNRAKAHDLMRSHFPDGYEITWEEEAKIGSATVVKDRTQLHQHPGMSSDTLTEYEVARQAALTREQNRGQTVVPSNIDLGLEPLGPGMSSNSTASFNTIDRTEWRLNYRRKRGGGGALPHAQLELTQGVMQVDAELPASDSKSPDPADAGLGLQKKVHVDEISLPGLD